MYNTDHTSGNAENHIGSKKAITVLTVIALVFAAVNFVSYFFVYGYNYGSYSLIFIFPDLISLISVLLYISPFILFTVYICKFIKSPKPNILVPITFGLKVTNAVFRIIVDIFYYEFYYRPIDLILDVLLIIAFGLAVFGALTGHYKKVFTVVASSFALLYTIIGISITSAELAMPMIV